MYSWHGVPPEKYIYVGLDAATVFALLNGPTLLVAHRAMSTWHGHPSGVGGGNVLGVYPSQASGELAS
jgi:hypothetical protein